jgi:hypothetical protein
MRYLGVLLYDAAGQECPVEFRLGADALGRVVYKEHLSAVAILEKKNTKTQQAKRRTSNPHQHEHAKSV